MHLMLLTKPIISKCIQSIILKIDKNESKPFRPETKNEAKTRKSKTNEQKTHAHSCLIKQAFWAFIGQQK